MDAVDLIGWILAAISIAALVWMVRAAALRDQTLTPGLLLVTCRCSMRGTSTSKKWCALQPDQRFNPAA